MKTTIKTKLFLLLMPVSILFLNSCKKSDDPSTQPSRCKLASLLIYPAGGALQTVSFLYDHEGKVKFINQDGATVEFIYESNAFTRVRPGTGNWVTRSYVQLNANGQPLLRKDTIYDGQFINNTATITYEYNSQGGLEKGISSNINLIPNINITWQNGNMVSITEGNTTVLLDYYTDKLNQDISIMGLKFLMEFGAYASKSKNLLKSVSSGTGLINYNYRFDDEGKIAETTWTLPGNPTPVATWQQVYDCD